jgi:hypothetical protein
MKPYQHTSSFGNALVIMKADLYSVSRSLAVHLIDVSDPLFPEPYLSATVCLPESSLLENKATDAFVNTNGDKGIIPFLEGYGIATPLDITAISGYCSYPAYRFNLDKLTF